MKNLHYFFIFLGLFFNTTCFSQSLKDSIASNLTDTAGKVVISKTITDTAALSKKDTARVPVIVKNIYYKSVNDSIIASFKDTSNKIIITDGDANLKFLEKFAYAQSFFPYMEYNKLKIIFKKSKKVVRIRPTFASIFEEPKERTYKLFYSNLTETTLDSVLFKNLSINSQIGLIAIQLSRLEDFRTSWFFDFIFWHFKQLSTKSRNKINYDDELRAVELGLGYQVFSLNKEKIEKLKIEKWQNTKGYAEYLKSDINRSMPPEIIMNFVNDLPIYNTKEYK